MVWVSTDIHRIHPFCLSIRREMHYSLYVHILFWVHMNQRAVERHARRLLFLHSAPPYSLSFMKRQPLHVSSSHGHCSTKRATSSGGLPSHFAAPLMNSWRAASEACHARR